LSPNELVQGQSGVSDGVLVTYARWPPLIMMSCLVRCWLFQWQFMSDVFKNNYSSCRKHTSTPYSAGFGHRIFIRLGTIEMV